MSNTYFRFKQFTVHQDAAAMKVTTDACLFGAWVASEIAAEQNQPEAVLDIGTGTGLLVLMLAQQCNTAIDAIEIEPGAASQARKNVEGSPFSNTIKVLEGDVRQYDFTKTYDCILSNPPFYEKDLKNEEADAKNLAHHDSGLLLQDLVPVLQQRLNQNGLFFLLLPARRTAAAFQYFLNNGFTLEKMIRVKPGPAHADFRILLRGRKTNQPAVLQTEELVIKMNAQEYSSGFIRLLKDYYLYL